MKYPCKRKKAFFCRYAVDTLIPLTTRLSEILSEVSTAEDSEVLHQCRVTTRKIRTALSLFEPCLSHKRIKYWEPALRKLTKSLSEARDLDVQISYVESLLLHTAYKQSSPLFFRSSTILINHPDHHETQVITGNSQETNDTAVLSFDSDQIHHIGLECLLLRLKQKRNEVQEHVLFSTCETIERNTLQRMNEELHVYVQDIPQEQHSDVKVYANEQICYFLLRKLDNLTAYAHYLSDPTAHLQHHKMRIITKQIIFILETTADLCLESLQHEIERVNSIQKLLESLHECDVWIEFIPGFLKEEKSLAMDYAGNTKIYDLIALGIHKLLDDQKSKRNEIFNEIVQAWEKIKKEDLLEIITAKISVLNNDSLQKEKIDELIPNLKIACISDIHSNLPALEAVINDAKARGVCGFVNAGDCIGYGASPEDVVYVVRNNQILSVIGNYDLDIITKKWKSRKVKSGEKKITMEWTYDNLSHKNVTFLQNLPQIVRLKIQGKTLLITHGSPESITEYLTADTPYSRLCELATSSRADVIITGHSHSPFIKEVAGTSFLNCGSVGRQEDRDPRASYAVITFNPFSIVQIRVPYNISKAVTKIRKNHLPKEFEQMAIMGCSLRSAKNRTKQKAKK